MTFSPVPDYFFTQSGVIPYRIQDGKLQILLITSLSMKNWIIPKGVVEPYLTPQESAAKEAQEEGGVFGRVWDEPIGRYEVEKWGGVCKVTVFPMLVTKVYDKWPECDERKRKWLSPKDAIDKASKKDIKKLIKRLARELDEKIVFED